jgi:hypothetical protein
MAEPPDRPPAVHIDDLADPVFDPEVADLMAAAAPLAGTIELSARALCRQAVRETGLDDLGDGGFLDRLDRLCRALEREADLSAFGRVTTSVQLTQLVKNRLLLRDLLARHPEILDEEIARPIVIAGLPRTGTTHLHNLLAADPALRSLPYWESLEPVLSPAEAAAVATGAPDPRLARTEAGVAFLNQALPLFRRMHEMTVDHVHEEIQLLAIDASSMLFETTAPMPSWRDHYLASDQTPHYRFLRTVLQALQWLRPGGAPEVRWVLKSPQHLEQLVPLTTVFPDATVVLTHRDPVSVTASMCTMIAYTARLHCARVDPVAIGAYWADRLARMLDACVRDRDRLPPGQAIDVHFDRFMADELGTLAAIYELADQPFAPAREALAAYRDRHPRGRHGELVYDLADFGLDARELRDRFAGYTSRFGVTEEPW